MKTVVVIPVYKKEPSLDECCSLRRCIRVLGRHTLRLVCPESLDAAAYNDVAGGVLPCERFRDEFFDSIEGYNRLMKSHAFYRRFRKYEYMLIYQLDAWVFSDELDAWCGKDYDYIGAPWFEKHGSREDGYDLWCAGNGGFSLRRISTFMRVTNPRVRMKSCREIFRDEYHSVRDLGHCLVRCLSPIVGNNTMRHYMKRGDVSGMWEDVFFSRGLVATRHRLRVPTAEEAARFSFEVSPRWLFEEMTRGKLPFGCHAWRRYQYDVFWDKYIRADAEGQAERLRRKWSMPGGNVSESEIKRLISREVCVPEPTKDVVDVVIPVYNGKEHLQRLMPLLFANTGQAHRFIFINDCSPDPRTREYIVQQTAGRDDCVLIDNECNMGFTGTVNRGAAEVRSDVFVILNTDVMVPPMWLERLTAPFADARVGTATPFTNSGSYYSFPHSGKDNALESVEQFLKIDEAFRHIVPTDCETLEFINGTGFCMAIRKSLWDRYGGLDAEAFDKGYGEENDLSFRYLSHGYRNVLVPNLFVYHRHGGSFPTEETKKLKARHMQVLRERWSMYLELLPLFEKNDPWAQYRRAALYILNGK